MLENPELGMKAVALVVETDAAADDIGDPLPVPVVEQHIDSVCGAELRPESAGDEHLLVRGEVGRVGHSSLDVVGNDPAVKRATITLVQIEGKLACERLPRRHFNRGGRNVSVTHVPTSWLGRN